MKEFALIKTHFDYKLESVEVNLAKFREKFIQNPAYALEWSQDAFNDAGRAQILKEALEILNYEGASEEELLKELEKHLMKIVRRAALYPARSTSAQSNLMEQAKAQAAAELLESIEG